MKNFLVIEQNGWHGEVLISIVSALLKFDCQVDVFANSRLEAEKALSIAPSYAEKLHCYYFNPGALKQKINSTNFDDYDYVIFNSLEMGQSQRPNVYTEYNLAKLPKEKAFVIAHHPQLMDQKLSEKANVITLVQNDNPDFVTFVPLYPDDNLLPKNKHSIVNFIVVGNIEPGRKNYSLLLSGINHLIKNGATNFKVTVIGKGRLSLPSSVSKFFEIKGRLDYQTMYSLLQSADYLLTLLDPTKKEHEKYLTDCVTGSFANTYGFAVPAIIPQKFAARYGLNETNSLILTEGQELGEKMLEAYSLESPQYIALTQQLISDSQEIKRRNHETLARLFFGEGQSLAVQTTTTETSEATDIAINAEEVITSQGNQSIYEFASTGTIQKPTVVVNIAKETHDKTVSVIVV